MNEKEYALSLKKQYEEACEAFEHCCVANNIKNLERDNINYNVLKSEVEKLGFHIELAKNIKSKHYQNEWKKEPFFIFYLNPSDI